jgi:hypothetical protein
MRQLVNKPHLTNNKKIYPYIIYIINQSVDNRIAEDEPQHQKYLCVGLPCLCFVVTRTPGGPRTLRNPINRTMGSTPHYHFLWVNLA